MVHPKRHAAVLTKVLSATEPIFAAIRAAIKFMFINPAIANEQQRVPTAGKSVSNDLAG